VVTVVLAVGLLITSRAAIAQQAQRVYRIGLLGSQSSYTTDDYIWAPFLAGLRGLGYTEGRNLVVERRYGQQELERLPALATELVQLKVDVIATSSTPAAIAAKGATPTIPIVLVGGASPVEDRCDIESSPTPRASR